MWLAMKKWVVGGAVLVASAVALPACGIGTTTVLQGQSTQKTDPVTSHRVPSRPASTVRPQGAARTQTSAGTIHRSTALGPTIHLWHMSLRVPKGWKLVARETSAGATVWTIRGTSGQAQLTSTPLSPRRDPEQLLPWPNGRYVWSTSSGPREVLVQLTTQKGTEDTLAVHLRSGLGGASLIPAIVGTWTHPPLMTVNRAVTQLEQLHRRGDYPYSLSYGTVDEGWLLAPGGGTVPKPCGTSFRPPITVGRGGWSDRHNCRVTVCPRCQPARFRCPAETPPCGFGTPRTGSSPKPISPTMPPLSTGRRMGAKRGP